MDRRVKKEAEEIPQRTMSFAGRRLKSAGEEDFILALSTHTPKLNPSSSVFLSLSLFFFLYFLLPVCFAGFWNERKKLKIVKENMLDLVFLAVVFIFFKKDL